MQDKVIVQQVARKRMPSEDPCEALDAKASVQAAQDNEIDNLLSPKKINVDLNFNKPDAKVHPKIIPANSVTLTFKNLVYTVRCKNPEKTGPRYIDKEILHNISGICRPGELTALMGASGAGKTSLLNLLSCRITPNGKSIRVQGSYLANGNTYNGRTFSKFAGYVMQNDILMETMTPREAFKFAADLRINGTEEEKVKRVNEIIEILNLKRAADTVIGGDMLKGISGGERKRTSTGVELITDPKILFLDEPTSGLDSFNAFILINTLKKLAHVEGKTVIFTIHQPSSDTFILFDKLFILAKGKFVYQGPTSNAVPYMESIGYPCPEFCNPADHFMEVVHPSGDDGERFENMFKKFDENLAVMVTKEVDSCEKRNLELAQSANSWWHEIKIVFKRSMTNTIRNPLNLRARIGQTFFFMFLLCSLYWQLDRTPTPENDYNIAGAIFFNMINMFMFNLMSVILLFPQERAVFLKEYSTNMYRVSSYFIGKSTVELPIVFLAPAALSAVTYYAINLNAYSAGKFFFYCLSMISVSLCANSVGLLCGCAFSDVRIAVDVVPLFIIPVLLFAGFFINSDSIPIWIRWIQWISPMRFGFEAMVWNEYTDSELGSDTIDRLNFRLGKWESWGILIGLAVFLRLAALFALKRLVRKLE